MNRRIPLMCLVHMVDFFSIKWTIHSPRYFLSHSSSEGFGTSPCTSKLPSCRLKSKVMKWPARHIRATLGGTKESSKCHVRVGKPDTTGGTSWNQTSLAKRAAIHAMFRSTCEGHGLGILSHASGGCKKQTTGYLSFNSKSFKRHSNLTKPLSTFSALF